VRQKEEGKRLNAKPQRKLAAHKMRRMKKEKIEGEGRE